MSAVLSSSGPGLKAAPDRDPAWIRRLSWLLAGLVLLWPMAVLTEFKPWVLLERDALKSSLNFLSGFLNPRVDAEFLALMAKETWRTVAIATCGIVLALVIAIPLSLLATRSLSVSGLTGRMGTLPKGVRQVVRMVLIGLRSIPELVWALVFVRVVGLGPTSGVLAIALAYGGMLGKVYCEILESGEAHATRSLLQNGSGRLQAFMYGLLPQNAAELTSYTVYRWECAIRSSAVLGFVGAGGVGQQLDTSMKMFAANEVCSLLLVFVGLVWLADWASAWLRKSLG
jgi:phosphonate transport system permease protein